MDVESGSSRQSFEEWRRQSLREVERWLDVWPIYLPDTVNDRDDFATVPRGRPDDGAVGRGRRLVGTDPSRA